MSFTLKQDDTLPKLGAVLEVQGAPLDLTSCSVLFRFRNKESGEVTTKEATVENAEAGEVSYSWGETDLATAGSYYGEFVVTYPSGDQITFPNAGYFDFTVKKSLNSL